MIGLAQALLISRTVLNNEFQDESLSGPRNNGLTSSEFDAYTNALEKVKSVGGGQHRSLCPMPECTQYTQRKHDSFTFNRSGAYLCHRCGAKGHLHELPKKLPHLGLPAPKHQGNGLDPFDEYHLVRGVSKATLDQYGVTFSGNLPSFPYPSGATKLKKPEGYVWTGSKAQRDSPGLFGADQITTSDSSQLWIVEGESDTLAFAEAGISAVSLPAGAGSVKERDIEALQALEFEDYVILYDKDIYGLKGSHKLREWMEASGLTATLLSYPLENVTAYDGVMAWNEADRKPELFQEVLDSLSEAPPIPEEWPEIVSPLKATPIPIPLDALTPVLRDIVRSVASSLQVPTDIPALLALCAVSGAVGGKFFMRIHDGWAREWSVLFGIAVAESGERKSPAYSIMTKPIRKWVRDEIESKESAVRYAQETLGIKQKQVQKLVALMANGETKHPKTKNNLEDELEDAINEEIKARKAIPLSPNVLVGDITQEKLPERASETGGRIVQMTPEGVILRLIDGKYKDQAVDAEFYKMGYDGETYQRDRVGKDSKDVTIENPAVTMMCAVQPEVLNDLRNKMMLVKEGLLGRCCFVQPQSLVGYRDPRSRPALDTDAYDKYEMSLQLLLEVDCHEADGPVEVTFHEDAVEELIDFVWKIEQQLKPSSTSELVAIREWALKEGGRVVRISAFQTMVARALESDDIFAPIELKAVQDAIRIVKAMATGASYTLGVMGSDRHTRILQDVLDRTIRLVRDGEDVTKRNLHRAMYSQFPKVEDLEPFLEELEERGYLKVKPLKSTGGRKPSPKLLLNPLVLDDTSDTSPTEETSVSSVTDDEAEYEEIERLAIQQESDDGLPF